MLNKIKFDVFLAKSKIIQLKQNKGFYCISQFLNYIYLNVSKKNFIFVQYTTW